MGKSTTTPVLPEYLEPFLKGTMNRIGQLQEGLPLFGPSAYYKGETPWEPPEDPGPGGGTRGPWEPPWAKWNERIQDPSDQFRPYGAAGAPAAGVGGSNIGASQLGTLPISSLIKLNARDNLQGGAKIMPRDGERLLPIDDTNGDNGDIGDGGGGNDEGPGPGGGNPPRRATGRVGPIGGINPPGGTPLPPFGGGPGGEGPGGGINPPGGTPIVPGSPDFPTWPIWGGGGFVPTAQGGYLEGGPWGFAGPMPKPVAGASPLQDWAAENIQGMFGAGPYEGTMMWDIGQLKEIADTYDPASSLDPNSPLYDVAQNIFNTTTKQALGNKFSLMGAGRSGGHAAALTREWQNMLLPLMLKQMDLGQENLSNRLMARGTSIGALQNMQNARTAREFQALDTGFGYGSAGRGIAQEQNDAIYDDYLRRQGLAAQGLFPWVDMAKMGVGAKTETRLL